MTNSQPNTATEREAALERVRLRFPGPYFVRISYVDGGIDVYTTDKLENVCLAYVDLKRQYERGVFVSFQLYNIAGDTLAMFSREDTESVINEAVDTAAALQQKVRYQ